MKKINEMAMMVDDCFALQDKLSEWESDFVNDISERLDDEDYQPTDKQLDKMRQIWGKLA